MVPVYIFPYLFRINRNTGIVINCVYMKLVVTIIIFNRTENLRLWLKCWPLCNQHGAELRIIHTGEDRELYKQLCDEAGAIYIPRENRGVDVGATQDVFRERLEGFNNDWDLLLWITDDVIPMSRDFITPFLNTMKPSVGLAAMQISDAHAPHVRTVAYMIGKATSLRVQFPADPMLDKEQGLQWEHRGGKETLTQQVMRMGLRCIQITPNETSPLWDTGYGKRIERMAEHYAVFPPPVKQHLIHHFYHIYADGKWIEPVTEHIRALKMGLLDQLTTFNIGIVGHPRNRRVVKQFLVEQGVFFNIIAQEQRGWEQTTMIPMWEFSQTNEGLILYCHSKGASDPNEVNIRWRRSMTYWNVIRWADAVSKLQTHGAVGCHWIAPLISMVEHKFGNKMMAGTFFWTHSNLMRTWPRPALTHRHEAEGFIGYGWHQKPFGVYDFTPYFPNTNTFYDDWISNPDFRPDDTGRTVEPV